MEKTAKNEERKRYNTPFLTAFDFYARLNTGGNQGKMAKLIGVHSSHISAYRSGDKRVSEDVMDSLIRASNNQINRYYLLGMSEYMLMENLPNDELARLQDKMFNPDHDAKQKAVSPSTDEPTTNILELYAKMIRGLDDLRQQLKDELAEVKAMKQEYLTARDDFRKAIAALHPSIKYVSPSDQPRMAAENTPEK
jgi:DNA-binding transcriptional regulator YdaS (Cro superfamily)